MPNNTKKRDINQKRILKKLKLENQIPLFFMMIRTMIYSFTKLCIYFDYAGCDKTINQRFIKYNEALISTMNRA